MGQVRRWAFYLRTLEGQATGPPIVDVGCAAGFPIKNARRKAMGFMRRAEEHLQDLGDTSTARSGQTGRRR